MIIVIFVHKSTVYMFIIIILYFSCDECQKLYHFQCLDPPLKKTPKRRGYSWHCADCDPTVSYIHYIIN